MLVWEESGKNKHHELGEKKKSGNRDGYSEPAPPNDTGEHTPGNGQGYHRRGDESKDVVYARQLCNCDRETCTSTREQCRPLERF